MTTLHAINFKDAELEMEIQKALHDSGKPAEVQAIARDGYIHLVGWANNLEHKRWLGSMVERIPGVRLVTNHLHVKPWEEKRGKLHF